MPSAVRLPIPRDAECQAMTTAVRPHPETSSFASLVEDPPSKILVIISASRHAERNFYVRPETSDGVLATIASQPGNRLNGDALQRRLTGLWTPVQSPRFGSSTCHSRDEGFGPFPKVGRKGGRRAVPRAYNPDVERLPIPRWLVSSNRHQRNSVTKARCISLGGHLDVAADLIERLPTAADPTSGGGQRRSDTALAWERDGQR